MSHWWGDPLNRQSRVKLPQLFFSVQFIKIWINSLWKYKYRYIDVDVYYFCDLVLARVTIYLNIVVSIFSNCYDLFRTCWWILWVIEIFSVYSNLSIIFYTIISCTSMWSFPQRNRSHRRNDFLRLIDDKLVTEGR